MKFTRSHEWIQLDGEVASVGVSAYAAEQLGDLVFVQLPEVGLSLARGDSLAVVESVKAASDVYSPVSGEVLEVNGVLGDTPEQMSEDAEGAGWLAKIRLSNATELDELMDRNAYEQFLQTV